MRILYVCTGNSFRSPAAEALTRRYRPQFEVESAGVDPAEEIAENLEGLLREEEALEHLKPHPDLISTRAVEEADGIKAMDGKQARYLLENFDVDQDKIDNWNIEDPIDPGVEPEDVFRDIKNKVLEL